MSQVKPIELGSSLMDTASDLMYVKPQLAIRLVSEAGQSSTTVPGLGIRKVVSGSSDAEKVVR